MAISCETTLRSLKGKINDKLKRHWKRVEAQIKSKPRSQFKQPATVEYQSKLDASLNLNFEYKFFEIIKSTLFDCSLIASWHDLEWIMSYCLNQCIQQINLFCVNCNYYANKGDGNQTFGNVTYDEHDELNMIELENNFQVNLLNMMHRFKDIYDKFPTTSISNDNFNFYDYMAALISIYLDISLELKSKLDRIGRVTRFKRKYLKQSMCINTFLLLDSIVYYVSNAILQMKNLNEDNLDLILPMVNKLVDIKQSCYAEKNNKSLYLRFVLLYARLRLTAKSNPQVLESYRSYILSLEIPTKFNRYVSKLTKKHYRNIASEKQKLMEKINDLSKPKKLRKFLSLKLSHENIDNLVIALHNKLINYVPPQESFSKQKLSIEYISDPKDFDLNTSPTIDGQTPQKLPDNLIQCVEEYIEKMEQNNDTKIPPSPHTHNDQNESLNMYDELEFTSCSELTQYDINDYEYDIVNPLNQSVHSEESKNCYESITKPCQAVLERLDPIEIDCSDFNFNKNELVDYSTPKKKIIPNTDNFLNYKVSEDRLYSSRKKYEQLLESRGSPTKETISNLNLFRNIFNDSENSDSPVKVDTVASGTTAFVSKPNDVIQKGKFYKINELVSVMLNDTQSPLPSPKSVESNKVEKKKILESPQFHQTKLNFQIKKMTCKKNPPVLINRSEKGEIKPKAVDKPTPVKKINAKKKKQPTKRKWEKVDYKSKLNKDYEMRKRNSIVNYFEPKIEPKCEPMEFL